MKKKMKTTNTNPLMTVLITAVLSVLTQESVFSATAEDFPGHGHDLPRLLVLLGFILTIIAGFIMLERRSVEDHRHLLPTAMLFISVVLTFVAATILSENTVVSFDNLNDHPQSLVGPVNDHSHLHQGGHFIEIILIYVSALSAFTAGIILSVRARASHSDRAPNIMIFLASVLSLVAFIFILVGE